MFSLRVHAVLAPLLLVACGGGSDSNSDAGNGGGDDASTIDAKVFMDAPPPVFDFACEGNTAPTTATATVTMTGKVQRVRMNGLGVAFDNLDGAALEACVAGTTCMGQDSLDTDTSANGGTFTLGPVDTGVSMSPVDAYISMSEDTSRTTYTYPGQPLVADQADIPILTFDPQLIPLLPLVNGCTQDDDANGMLGLAVTDCADTPITDSSNIILTVKQNGSPISVMSDDVMDLGTFDPAAAGTFLICNVPPNDMTEVSGSYKGMALRAHTVKVVKATTTATILRPGF